MLRVQRQSRLGLSGAACGAAACEGGKAKEQTMTPRKLRNELKSLRAEVAKLRPAPAPGILTNRTTRGVTRRPLRTTTSTTSSDSDDTVPTWG